MIHPLLPTFNIIDHLLAATAVLFSCFEQEHEQSTYHDRNVLSLAKNVFGSTLPIVSSYFLRTVRAFVCVCVCYAIASHTGVSALYC